jgi:hypothetical protein
VLTNCKLNAQYRERTTQKKQARHGEVWKRRAKQQYKQINDNNRYWFRLEILLNGMLKYPTKVTEMAKYIHFLK